MDFGQTLQLAPSVVTQSNISILPLPTQKKNEDQSEEDLKVNNLLLECANEATLDHYQVTSKSKHANHTLYPHQTISRTDLIQPNSLCVIFESFDNLNFVYATPNAIFSNRNGHFHHNDFLQKPYGCKIRSRNRLGYGFVYLLKPTCELWTRSLNHRTQIIHELDSSVIVQQLKLRPNSVVCESGTGSGSMSHAFVRTIAPYGHLHTFEFNKARVDAAREEFDKNGIGHLVTVYHRDVCGKKLLSKNSDNSDNSNPETIEQGFGPIPDIHTNQLQTKNVADAVLLDLPEPWLAVPPANQILKRNGRIGSYSPCVEQSQKTIQKMMECGFHSIQTIEVRFKEYYVDALEMEMPPLMQLPDRAQSISWNHTDGTNPDTNHVDKVDDPPVKKRKLVGTRPMGNMRGHTAFLTFATAGLV